MGTAQRGIVALTKRCFERYGTPPPSGPYLYCFSPFSQSLKLTPATHILTSQPVLIKAIAHSLLSVAKFKAQLDEEIGNLQRVKHINVIQLLELVHCKRHLVLVFDCKPGRTLAQVLRHERLQEGQGRRVFRAVAEGLAALHESGVVHRDLKPENIQVEEGTGNIKIAGLENSRKVRRGQEVTGVVSAPAYMPPESLLGKGFDGYAADIWSLGVFLYVILSGFEPFTGPTILDIQKAILRGNMTWPDGVPEEARNLVKGMMEMRPQARLSMRNILDHVWLRGDSKPAHFSHSRPHSPVIPILPSVLHTVEALGYPRLFTLSSLRSHTLTHASVCYHLLNRP